MENMFKEISKKGQTYLLTTKCHGNDYETESQIIYRFICLNYSDNEIESLFKKYACKETYFKKNKITKFRNLLSKLRVYYANNKNQFDIECDQIIDYINYFTALTVYERIIFKSILKISKLSGKFDNLNLSLRRLSYLSNTSIATVQQNLKKLCNKKILVKIKESNYIEPATYSVNSQVLLKSINSNTTKNKNFKKNDYYNKEIYSKANLNKSGYLIIDLLHNNPNKRFDTKTISNMLNISFPTVKKKLDLMKERGIVKSTTVKTVTKPKKIYQIKEFFNIEKFK